MFNTDDLQPGYIFALAIDVVTDIYLVLKINEVDGKKNAACYVLWSECLEYQSNYVDLNIYKLKRFAESPSKSKLLTLSGIKNIPLSARM